MDVILRKAEPSDMTAVLSLIKELAAFENEPGAVEISENSLEKTALDQIRPLRPSWRKCTGLW